MSPPEENKTGNYSRYDQMSTAELEQLLRLDFQASEKGGSDLDAILYISALLAKRNGPSDTDAAWAQFQTKYRPYATGRSLYDFEDEKDCCASGIEQASAAPSNPRSRSVRCLRRLAVLAAVLAALLLSSVVAQAAGLNVFGALARWTDETFRFVSAVSTMDQAGRADTAPYQASLQAWEMDGLFPTWHPNGFAPGDLEVNELHNWVTAHVTYFGEDRTYSVTVDHFTQPQSDTGTFEKDDTPVEEYDHNGQTFYILSNLDTLTATSYDGEFTTMIFGALTREEIKAIIDSIPAPYGPAGSGGASG